MTVMQQAPEFLRGVKTPRTLMLLYHRIDDLSFDPQLLSVTPAHFDEHLQVLQKKYRALPLSHLIENGGSKRRFSSSSNLSGSSDSTISESVAKSANSIVVTFDDGYADNLKHALPLLEKHQIPATVFITTGIVQQRNHFWWDELARVVLGQHDVPEQLELTLSDSRAWTVDNAGGWSERCDADWNLLCEHDPTERHKLYRDVSCFLRGASEPERERVLECLRGWAGLAAPGEARCVALTTDELVTLSASELIEIGSHTVHHPVLSSLALAEQEAELRDSKKYLESLLEREVDHFAFPYGTKSDYSAETIALVKSAGYKSACSNIAEAIWAGTDQFQFPRLLVRDCDGDYFEKWIGAWFGEN